MKLKMAEKSLFAILLRSPWWISFALALAVSLAARALLPAAYAGVGMMGGFPFVVIGCIALWRQARAPSAATVQATLERAAAMNWRDFSAALQAAYKRQGYSISVTTGRENAAADFQLRKEGASTLVCARRWKAANPGVEALRELVALRQAQDVRHCSYISLAPLSPAAAKFAQEQRINVPNASDLALLLASK